MLQPRGDADLAREPLGGEVGPELGVQALERDRRAMPQILREIDRRHTARTELALDHVAVDERLLGSGTRVHQTTRRGVTCGRGWRDVAMYASRNSRGIRG